MRHTKSQTGSDNCKRKRHAYESASHVTRFVGKNSSQRNMGVMQKGRRLFEQEIDATVANGDECCSKMCL